MGRTGERRSERKNRPTLIGFIRYFISGCPIAQLCLERYRLYRRLSLDRTVWAGVQDLFGYTIGIGSKSEL